MLFNRTSEIFFFRFFRLYLVSRMRFEVENTWAWNSSVSEIAILWVLWTEFDEKWLVRQTLMSRTSGCFFRIFRPHPCPGMRYEVGKTWLEQCLYDLIFLLMESGDDLFNRSYLVGYLEFFQDFSFTYLLHKKKLKAISTHSVSYTHLTLPTIYSV